jgi:hypothetical protein
MKVMPKKTTTNPSPVKTAAAPRTTTAKHRRAKATVAESQPAQPEFTITHEDVATLAFSYWESRGYRGGSPEEDWHRAEQELRSLLG